MKSMPLLALGLVAFCTSSCQKGKFAEDTASATSYEVNVVDTQGADGTAKVEVTGTGTGTGTGDDGKTTDDGKATDVITDSKSGPGNGKGSKDSSNDSVDAQDCAAAAGLSKDRIKVSGSEKDITLSPQQAFALKVSGNSNQVHVKMSADSPATKLAAVCVFVTGNQSHVTFDISMAVGQIFIKARGNQALVEAQVNKEGAIESLDVDAKGHEPSIVLKGEGKYPCDTQASVRCE